MLVPRRKTIIYAKNRTVRRMMRMSSVCKTGSFIAIANGDAKALSVKESNDDYDDDEKGDDDEDSADRS